MTIVSGRRTPHEAISDFIIRYEGIWQDNPEDAGNYLTFKNGNRVLVGTMRGVSAAAFANWFMMPPEQVTPQLMQQLVTLEAAVSIGYERYYKGLGIRQFMWSAPAEAMLDYAWGSAYAGIMRVQQMLGCHFIDGIIGNETVGAWNVMLRDNGVERMLNFICDVRIAHYNDIVSRKPSQKKYLDGWIARANGFASNSSWYKIFWKGA